MARSGRPMSGCGSLSLKRQWGGGDRRGRTLDVHLFVCPDADARAEAVALEGGAGEVAHAAAVQGPAQRRDRHQSDVLVFPLHDAVVEGHDAQVEVVVPYPVLRPGASNGHAFGTDGRQMHCSRQPCDMVASLALHAHFCRPAGAVKGGFRGQVRYSAGMSKTGGAPVSLLEAPVRGAGGVGEATGL